MDRMQRDGHAADPDHSVSESDSSASVEITVTSQYSACLTADDQHLTAFCETLNSSLPADHGAETDVHHGHDLRDIYEPMENASSPEERDAVVWELINSRRPKANIQIPAQAYKDKRK